MSLYNKNKDFLYQNFLNNATVYKQNEAYWARLVQQTLAPYDIQPKPWLNKYYGDGSPMLDGNPIYDALLGNGKALRIIQVAPDSEDVLISAWMNTTEKEEGEDLEELVVHLQLTKATKAVTLLLLERWLVTEDKKAMEAFIESTLNHF